MKENALALPNSLSSQVSPHELRLCSGMMMWDGENLPPQSFLRAKVCSCDSQLEALSGKVATCPRLAAVCSDT